MLAGALRGCRVCTCLCWPQQFALLLHGHHQALQPNALQVSDFNLSKVLDDSMRNSSLAAMNPRQADACLVWRAWLGVARRRISTSSSHSCRATQHGSSSASVQP